MSRKFSRTPKNSQTTFKGLSRPSDCFGGSLLKNSHAKTRRPLSSKLPIHVVLRAEQSCLRLPKTFATVADLLEKTARRHGVRLYSHANVGNHLHLLLKIRSPQTWAAFIRELTGRIAQEVGAKVNLNRKFWRFRPFTRIVKGWRTAFQTAKQYIYLNRLEAEGFISRQETRTLKDLKLIFDG